MSRANALRGEAEITIAGEPVILRPSFQALVAAEEELGSLFELVERAAGGRLKLSETTALFHHLSVGSAPHVSREQVGEAIATIGLARTTPILRTVLGQILQGRQVLFADAACRCWNVAARLLGWRPDDFWSATPAELARSLIDPAGEEEPVARALLDQLRQRFPDEDQING